jgi:hypothetical protein
MDTVTKPGVDGTRYTGLFNVKPELGRTIRRRAYTRKTGTRVPSRMIRDVGAPGKGGPGIGTLKKGLMSSLGYRVGAKATARHRAIDKAVKKYGKLSTLRKLNAVAVYTRRTSPVKSRTFKSDVKYVQKKY